MVSFPPCKINLGLNVLSKRPDGYHEIETCFYPVPFTDILEIIPSDELEFTSSGIAIPGTKEENLCLKAYHFLKNDFKLSPVKIHLHKIIPIGAGLGGGSSDAASMLRTLNSIFNLRIKVDQLKDYATKLGSDCSFFIEDKPMLGSGRGEVLKEIRLSLKGKFIVLIVPHLQISTKDAYAWVTPQAKSKRVETIIEQVIETDWKNELENDFENSVFQMYPIINEIKQKLYNHHALYASMSGSGSAVYGIFERPVDLRNQFEGTTYWSGVLPD